MTTLFASIRRVLARRRRTRVVHECRDCGRTVDAGTRACPSCDSASIARYEIR